MINTGKLAGLTVFITGASRGIGKAIALKVAKDGANVVIAAKTAEPHPKLPGTVHSTCKEVEEAGGKGLACVVDVRDESQVRRAIEEAVKTFGGIDILVNNASAISLTGTQDTDMKRYDLMHNINTRGTFLVTKECLPYLKKSSHAHILNMSPPLNLSPHWFKNNVAYTMAKYGMSMCVLGMHEEFRAYNIAVNALWPRTAIHTAAIEMLTGSESAKFCRKPEILADAAYAILTQEPKAATGNFYIDDEILPQHGVTDMDQYAVDLTNKDKLMPDFFIDDKAPIVPTDGTPSLANAVKKVQGDGGKISQLFGSIEGMLSPSIVEKSQAVFRFVITGKEAGTWFLDLKNGNGSCGEGEPSSPPDATFTTDSDNVIDMFSGRTKPATAFMTGKLKISGNIKSAMKLDGLLSKVKSKL